MSSLDEPFQSAPATPPRIPSRPVVRQELGFGEVDLVAAASSDAPTLRGASEPVLGDEEPFPFESPVERSAAGHHPSTDGHLAFGERSLQGEPLVTHPAGSEPPVDATGDVTLQDPLLDEPAPLPARRVPPPLRATSGVPAAEPPVDDSSLEELFDAPEPTRPADAAATRQLGDAATRQLGDAAVTAVVPPPALERKEPSGDVTGKRPAAPWRRKIALAAAAVILVVGVAGGAATFTPYGAFFHRAFGGKPNPHRAGARFLAEARQRLAEDRFTSIKSAVELTDRALRLDARDAEAQATYTYAASLLARRHGAAAAPWTRARAFLPELGKRVATDPDAAKAVVGAALVTGDRSAGAALTALEKHAAKPGTADGDALLLLGDAALQRADDAQATMYYRRLEALQPGSVRANHSLGVAAARRGDAAEARRLLEAALGRDPLHLTTVVELASLAYETGDAERAESLAREVLSDGQAAAGPRERARARTIMGLLLVRGIDEHIEASLGAAERELEAAVQEDPEDVEPRIAFAQFLLDRGAIDRAVAVLGPVPAGLRGARAITLHARLLAVQGKAAEAMAVVDAALEKAPGDARLLYAKGVLANDAGKHADADRLLTDAIQRDPSSHEPHLALAQARFLRGDLEGADRELKLAAGRAAGNARVLSTGADLLLARRELAGAEAGYDAALAADRSHGPAYLGLARVALEWRDPVAARTYLQRAVAVAPRLAPAQALYGEVQWKAGDLAGARKAFERAVALDPRDAPSLARLGAIELLQGDRDAAVTHLGAAATLTVPSAEVRAWYGRALLAKGEPQSALEQLKKSIELDARDPLVHLQLGQAYERLSNPSDAAQAYRTAQELAPGLVEAREALGMLYAGQNRCKEALPELEKASVLRTDNRIRMALADCKEKLGRHQEAVALYRRVLQADPKQVGLYYKIARAQHEASGFTAAVSWYEQAAREEPTNAMPHYYMGFAHKERGRPAKAVAEFREYLRISPNALDRADIEREIEDLGAAGDPGRP